MEPVATPTAPDRCQSVRVAKLSSIPPSAQVSLARAFVRGLVAGLMLVFGTLLIYGFGAGYFGALAVPTPLNFVVASVMLLGLILVLWRFVVRRL
jgi:formate/nitrite transporter FocA (FNT family)